MSKAMGDTSSTDEVEDNIIRGDDVIDARTPALLSEQTPLSEEVAGHIINLIDVRASNSNFPRKEVVIVLDEWATMEKYGPITKNSHVLIAGKIQEYSDDSYYLEGTYEVLLDALHGTVSGDGSGVLQVIDETEDGAQARGRKYLPTSAIHSIGIVE